MASVTFFSIALAVYQGFFYERKPLLIATVNSLSPVFDVVKPVGGLDISYAGVNLREAKKSLWSVDLTLRNEGNSEIKLDDFDPNAPVRVLVKSAQVVDKPSLTTSNQYLSANVKLITGIADVSITPVIIEPEDTITINFLILGAEGVRPTIEILGKIAGMKTIPLRTIDSSSNGKSWWQQVVGADALWVQIVRGPIYLLCTIFTVAIFTLLAAAASSPFTRWQNKRDRDLRIQEIRRIRLEKLFDQKTNALAEEYIENGIGSIAQIASEAARAESKIDAHQIIGGIEDEEAAKSLKKMIGAVMPKRATERLSKLGLIGLEDGKPIGVVELNEALEAFCQLIGNSREELIKTANKNRLPPGMGVLYE
ncbi:hypothetical protein C9I57_17995 [Trinickia symbiotica]|uniref:Uncharacterized protein n=2 Tax=Trinickia symbiotica TaxID=863227 RepID=A0A2T3XSZ2_9BURK|nr:hypothetical protein C9I57_17995 [Trinickia symbiotica]